MAWGISEDHQMPRPRLPQRQHSEGGRWGHAGARPRRARPAAVSCARSAAHDPATCHQSRRVARPRRARALARGRGTARPGQRRARPAERQRELPRVARRARHREAVHLLRELHLLGRRDRATHRIRPRGAGPARRAGPGPLRLARWPGGRREQDRAAARCCRRRGAGLQPAAPRPSPRMALPRSSQDHRDRWRGRVRVGALRERPLGRRCGSEEWRDTGVEVRGPAVADVERAFGSTWFAAGGVPIPAEEVASRGAVPAAGEAAVRVVATEPNAAGRFRLDLLVSGLARRSLFLADAYFFATTPYVEALRAAARDGVDVRLLVPCVSDLWLLSAVSRAGYRPLLEMGVRVFEWNGPMMHAKNAVADGRWDPKI